MIDTRRFERRLRPMLHRLRAALNLTPRRKRWGIEFSIEKGNTLSFFYTDAHQSRHEATMHLLLEALKTIKYELPAGPKLVHIHGRPPANQVGQARHVLCNVKRIAQRRRGS